MNDQAKQYQQLIAKCWADDAFKQRLLADPARTLAAEGIEIPAGVNVKIVENTSQLFHLVIPVKLTELHDELLDASALSGGVLFGPGMQVANDAYDFR